MFEKKFNWKVYFFILLFGGTVALVAKAMFLTATNQVMDENGAPLHPILIGLICVLGSLACSTYLITFVTLLTQVISHRNVAFRIDEAGIHNTVVCIYLLAFVVVAKVKFIPWHAVHYIDRDKDSIYIRVRTRQISASFIGKIIIGLLGYHFCYSFTSKKLSQEEMNIISSYCTNQSSIQSLHDVFRVL